MTWSYSHLNTFEQCPRQYQWKYVEKNKEPQGEPILWGNTVHKALELRVKHNTPLPESCKPYEWVGQFADAAKKHGLVLAEHSVGLTRELKPTGFFDKDVWYRGKIDLAILGTKTLWEWDYKTGKPKTDQLQMDIFAMAGLLTWPQVDAVRTRFAWLGHKTCTDNFYPREKLIPILKDILPRVARMERDIVDGRFEPQPNGLCRAHCPVLACKFNGRG